MIDERICDHCGGEIRIRNPKGFCDHLYYPDYCEICSTREEVKPFEKEIREWADQA
jgi:hypothetical protein